MRRWFLFRIGNPGRLRSQNPGVRGESDPGLDAVSRGQPRFPLLRNPRRSWERRPLRSGDGPRVGPRQYRRVRRQS